jgi:arylsulfatase A-like enzyme
MRRSEAPNILVFFTDQQRWDTAGCYGENPMGLTPNLDAMAARGVLCRRAFTVQPVCAPARGCLQTGRYATDHGVWRNVIPLPPTARTLAHKLADAGYWTGYIGKWHLAEAPGVGPGYVPPELRGGYRDLWQAANLLELASHPHDLHLWGDTGEILRQGYRVDAQTDLVLEALKNLARDTARPWFLFVSYLEPHQQNDWNRFVAPEGYAERYAQSLHVPPDLANLEGDWPEQLPSYYGAVASLDENLGRVLRELERLAMNESTVVLFCSDHGCHFRTRNQEYKRSCHESSIRIPVVWQGPGFDHGLVVNELVTLLDCHATLLRAAGVPEEELGRGRDITSIFWEEREEWPREVFIQISESQVGRAIRTRRWKFGVNAPDCDGWRTPAASRYVAQYLYDLYADPHELNNLACQPKFAEVREELAATLLRCMAAAGEDSAEIVPEAIPDAD